jgi:hypothetical protein
MSCHQLHILIIKSDVCTDLNVLIGPSASYPPVILKFREMSNDPSSPIHVYIVLPCVTLSRIMVSVLKVKGEVVPLL